MDNLIDKLPLNLKDAIDLYNKLNDSVNTAWSFYTILALAILGFMYNLKAGEKYKKRNRVIKIAATIGFAAWSLGHLYDTTLDLINIERIAKGIREYPAMKTPGTMPDQIVIALSNLKYYSTSAAVSLHLGIDTAVVIGIWLEEIARFVQRLYLRLRIRRQTSKHRAKQSPPVK